MKASNRSFPIWVLLLLSVFQAQLEAQPATSTNAQHCLWKVNVKTNAVYLLGSIHFLNKSFYPLAPVIEEAYQKAGAVAFEADLEELKSAKVQIQMLLMGKCGEGETLEKLVSKEAYSKLQEYLKERGLPGGSFDQFKPWMAAVGLMGIELLKLGFDPAEGVDQHFYNAARKDKKRIISLETAEAQLNLFGELTKADQEAMLKEALEELGSYKKVLDEIVQAWKTGNSQELDKLVGENMREFPDLYKKMLVNRNHKWTQKLERAASAGQDLLVVVGAAHLVGKDSVVEMLRKKGYPVEQK